MSDELDCPVPWGLAQILVVLGITVAGWAAVYAFAHLSLVPLVRAHPIDLTLILTAVVYAILYGAIALVIPRAAGWRALGYRFPGWRSLLSVLSWLPAWYAALAIIAVGAAYLINHGQPIPTNATELFGPAGAKSVGPVEIGLAFVVVAGIAPLVEETFFRGVLYQWLRGHLGVVPGVALSALIFAGAHVLPLLLPVLFAMGCMLAAAFQRQRSIFASMLLHGTNNAIAILAVLTQLHR